ncbi:hypothetical protein AXK12_06730 [Cephaloticoccus capnophilus]|uniref:YhcH/YjgK/YiaL family protein n=1 Tax=Cephaloticoccus capnophilus TaxID=1548208 RepID=A0A139SK20_9BACT|nr:hypothetical protein AXK12_06730 [Cephaloticoccus capnophilus]
MRTQTIGWPGFAAAFAYIDALFREASERRAQLFALKEGESQRQDLEGGAFAIAQVYAARPRYGVFESHRRYHDIQVVVAGEEQIEVAETALLTLTQAYDEERDVAFYADYAAGSVLRFKAGEVAVFAPCDGHMPSVRSDGFDTGSAGGGLVYKVVVKVPVE